VETIFERRRNVHGRRRRRRPVFDGRTSPVRVLRPPTCAGRRRSVRPLVDGATAAHDRCRYVPSETTRTRRSRAPVSSCSFTSLVEKTLCLRSRRLRCPRPVRALKPRPCAQPAGHRVLRFHGLERRPATFYRIHFARSYRRRFYNIVRIIFGRLSFLFFLIFFFLHKLI